MIYFVLYLFIEIFVSVEVASEIGPFWTFVEVMLSAVAGLLLLTNFRYTFFENMRALAEGEMTPERFQNQNIAALIGAILLIVPGFFTDMVGILLQFGVFTNLLMTRLARKKRRDTFVDDVPFHEGETDVIDVEIIDTDRSHR